MADIATADLWNLQADPVTLDTLGQAWTAQAAILIGAQDTVDRAAARVIGGEAWTGLTAEAFDSHRKKLTADLAECGQLAGKVARALGYCAEVLRRNQGLLDDERQKLAGIAVSANGDQLTFHPEDDQQAVAVRQAIQAAVEIRSAVDSELRSQAVVFQQAAEPLRGWQTAWTKRTLRMLNWNIEGGGKGNSFWGIGGHGTQSDDIPRLAERLINGDVDVATFEEVWKKDAKQLEDELNKHAAPGEHWEVHFGKTKSGRHWSEGIFGVDDDAGNVVVVRTRPGVSTDGDAVIPLTGKDARAATKVHINVD
jgi:hypothetical protein